MSVPGLTCIMAPLATPVLTFFMENRRDQLKRLIAHYRRQLADGVNGAIGQLYMQEIIKAEAELELLNRNDNGTDKRE